MLPPLFHEELKLNSFFTTSVVIIFELEKRTCSVFDRAFLNNVYYTLFRNNFKNSKIGVRHVIFFKMP